MIWPLILGHTTKSICSGGESALGWIKVSSKSRKRVLLSGEINGGSRRRALSSLSQITRAKWSETISESSESCWRKKMMALERGRE
ncbi:uncharacterized protein G2W53_006395 [Senna tora]|uniref:Uncharacterized protein n=1 Tax=Senna tora TaxID=362788 RepID=A0A834X5H2_9FABA|nr:uncharacterized protein G2W53_006395 [Senna tora]